MSLPTTIEAIAISKTGGLEVLEKITLPFPEQKPEDIVVKVRASACLYECGEILRPLCR